jgi:hypothetical protein
VTHNGHGAPFKFVPGKARGRKEHARARSMGGGELKPKGSKNVSQNMTDASHQEASMPEINTRFLFTLALEIQVSSLGDTPYGRRRISF